MGHDEDKKYFNARVGMRPSRNISAAQAELDRIAADSNPNAVPVEAAGGDIVLNEVSNSKKSPKIFLLLTLIMVIIIAIVVGVVVVQKSKKVSTKKTNPIDYSALSPIKNDIAKYAVLLEKGTIDGEYEKTSNVSTWYTVAAVSGSEITPEDKYQHALRLYAQHKEIKQAVSTLEDSNTKKKFVDTFDGQEDSIFIVSEYLKNQYIMGIVINDFLINGVNSATAKLNEYNSYIEKSSENSSVRNWYEKVLEIRKLSLDSIVVYNSNECVLATKQGKKCKSYTDIESKLSKEMTDWQNAANSSANVLCNSVIGVVEQIDRNKK